MEPPVGGFGRKAMAQDRRRASTCSGFGPLTAFRHKGDFGMQEPRDWGADVFPAVGEPLLMVVE
jgi:hypothetical protein